MEDSRDWGNHDSYLVSQGYLALLSKNGNYQSSSIWKNIWSNIGTPKIKTIYWILVQGKILIRENLQRRGILGPLSFSLYSYNGDTMKKQFRICLWSVPSQNKSSD